MLKYWIWVRFDSDSIPIRIGFESGRIPADSGPELREKSGILSTFTDRFGAPILQNFANNQKGEGAKKRFLRARHRKWWLLLRGIGARPSPDEHAGVMTAS